jgi:hypothetical protein
LVEPDCSEFLIFKNGPYDGLILRLNLKQKCERDYQEQYFKLKESEAMEDERKERLETVIERDDDSLLFKEETKD